MPGAGGGNFDRPLGAFQSILNTIEDKRDSNLWLLLHLIVYKTIFIDNLWMVGGNGMCNHVAIIAPQCHTMPLLLNNIC